MADPDATAPSLFAATRTRRIIAVSPSTEWIALSTFCRQWLPIDYACLDPLLRHNDDPLYARLLEAEILRQWMGKLLDQQRPGRIELRGICDRLRGLLPAVSQWRACDPDAETIELVDASTYVCVQARRVTDGRSPSIVTEPPPTVPAGPGADAAFIARIADYVNSLGPLAEEEQLRRAQKQFQGEIRQWQWRAARHLVGAANKLQRRRPRKQK